ncbi:cell wall hydrolase [Fonticella tunisiensis]|uniref:LysM domain-containing protein n=1 Tax=Fonticella tunisiensis TaxID=1096341 RepID=A0A4R7KSP5_9CLOT|nr:cell wall hydrolase [Fonticella tunisiensis]TDT61122.1 LysM domain-containing protein [Fonticella tunisiensis]
MFKSKKLKTFLFALSTTMALTIFTKHNAFAAAYKVTSGDSLFKISRLFNTTASEIKSTNDLGSDVIYPGQVLNVPAETYTVKSGDTLFLISKRFGISLDALRKANNKWDNLIYPGQKLILPKGNVVSSQPKAVIPYTQDDLDLLARLIQAEAENQPYSAKVAVGAVVVNRVQSSQFPNTIREVIYQRINGYYQFTPVLNGTINNPASAESRRAACEALNGADPTNGALFYFDDSATNQWLWSKPLAARIDRMVFVY